MKPMRTPDTRKARLYFLDGRVDEYSDNNLAYAVWLALPRGIHVAFRGTNDTRPVYPWDCVDVLP